MTTTVLVQGYSGPDGIRFSICEMHVTQSAAASQEFCGGKIY